MAIRLNEVERKWMLGQLVTSGVTIYNSMTPYNDIKRHYYISILGANSERKSLGDMEIVWLINRITTAGGTPQGTYTGDLWKQLNAAEGFNVSKSIDQNKMTYYLNK